MYAKAAANTSVENATDSSKVAPSKAEDIALCTAYILSFVFIVVGNLVTIVLFAVSRGLRKRSLFLVINMAFADLMLGTISLPIYIYSFGRTLQLWKGGWSMTLSSFYMIVDTFFSQASLISAAFISGERFYAIYWPFKHRRLSMRAYLTIACTAWALTLLITTLLSTSHFSFSYKRTMYSWMPCVLILTFIICGCNIGIWRKFRPGNIASRQQNRNSQHNRLTKTLLFVSMVVLVSWLPLIILNCLIYVFDVQIPWKCYYLVNVINYSNSFVNPVVYALRIPEFRETLKLCCLKRSEAPSIENNFCRNKKSLALTSAPELRTLSPETSHLHLAFEHETKL